MKISGDDREYETLVAQLNDPETLETYKKPLDTYRVSLLPRLLGKLLVVCGNFVYGRTPSYLKFRAVEVIARVPYHSWESASFTLLTMFYTDADRALRFSKTSEFARFARDNETMHVVVISELTRREEKAGVIRHTIIPLLFAFFYFWMSYFLYLINSRWSFELNYMFEQHAFDQYSLFLKLRGEVLKRRKVESEYLNWYGRNPIDQYDFFMSVRNDEIIHRNTSIHQFKA